MTGEDYARALERLGVLMSVDPAPDSIYGKELLRIVGLIEAYEREHFAELSFTQRCKVLRGEG